MMASPHIEPTLKQKILGLVGSLTWFFASLLPLSMRWAVGRVIGFTLYYTVSSRRKIVLRNLELCFPEKSLEQRKLMARKTFENAGRGFLSWGFALFASQSRIEREMNWQGQDTFKAFIKLNRSVILLCPHFCAPMLTLRTIGTLTPVVAMYRPPRNPVFDMGYHSSLTGTKSDNPWINSIYRKRTRHDLSMVPSRGNMRPFFRALDSGTPFFYLPDQNANRKPHATFAPFFDVPAATYTSLTRFTQFRNSRIILCHTVMSDTHKRYELRTELLPDDFISGDVDEDAKRLNQLIESLIRQNPDQYFWLHRRFATRPDGEPPIY